MCLLARDEAFTFSAKPFCGWGQFSLASTAGWRSRSNGADNLQPHPQNGIHTYQHTQICGCHSLLVHFCTHGVGTATSVLQSDLCEPWQLIQQAFAQTINFTIHTLPAGVHGVMVVVAWKTHPVSSMLGNSFKRVMACCKLHSCTHLGGRTWCLGTHIRQSHILLVAHTLIVQNMTS